MKQPYDLFVHGEDTEGQVDVFGDTVLHELELTIRRDEGNGTVLIELTQTNTTMEGAIIDFDTSALTTAVALGLLLVGDQQLIVQTETTFGHTGQESLHDNLTDDFATKHSTGLRDEEIDALQGINEHLVLTVGDTFTTPTHHTLTPTLPIDSTSDLRGNGAGILFNILGSSTQTNQHLHEIDGAVLRITVIQHFYTSHDNDKPTIEDFVHDREALTQIILYMTTQTNHKQPCIQHRSSS